MQYEFLGCELPKCSIYDELAEEIIKDEKFKDIYKKLLKSQKIGDSCEKELVLEEIIFLINSSSIFCFCLNEKFKQYSYKIAAILSERYSSKYENLTSAIQYIMICSGHLPVIKKIVEDGNKDHFSIYTESNIPFNPFNFKNIIVKQTNNTFEIGETDSKLYFTDFQRKSFKDLCEGKSISLSAPTSAGKSFLLVAYLAKKFQRSENLNVIYIVPTRALITQVLKDIKSELKNLRLAIFLLRLHRVEIIRRFIKKFSF